MHFCTIASASSKLGQTPNTEKVTRKKTRRRVSAASVCKGGFTRRQKFSRTQERRNKVKKYHFYFGRKPLFLAVFLWELRLSLGNKDLLPKMRPFEHLSLLWKSKLGFLSAISFCTFLHFLWYIFIAFRQLYIYCYKILDLGQRGEGENKIFRNPSVDAPGQKYEGSKKLYLLLPVFGWCKRVGKEGGGRKETNLLSSSSFLPFPGPTHYSCSSPSLLFLITPPPPLPLPHLREKEESFFLPWGEKEKKEERRRKSCHGLVGCPEEQSKTPSFFPCLREGWKWVRQ